MSKLETLITRCNPDLGPDRLMLPAWIGFLNFACGFSDLREAYEAETGRKWALPKTYIDRLIDESTGAGEEHLLGFCEWATRTQWGCAPTTPESGK